MAENRAKFELVSCIVFFKQPNDNCFALSAIYLTGKYPFYVRSGIEKACLFISRLVVERTEPGSDQSILLQSSNDVAMENPINNYVCHANVYNSGLAITTVASKEYPRRIAIQCMNTCLAQFQDIMPKWKTFILKKRDENKDKDLQINLPQLVNICKRYEHPEDHDKLIQIDIQISETSKVMAKNIDEILDRGESLERLVSESNTLEARSKVFLGESKKAAACWRHMCIMM